MCIWSGILPTCLKTGEQGRNGVSGPTDIFNSERFEGGMLRNMRRQRCQT